MENAQPTIYERMNIKSTGGGGYTLCTEEERMRRNFHSPLRPKIKLHYKVILYIHNPSEKRSINRPQTILATEEENADQGKCAARENWVKLCLCTKWMCSRRARNGSLVLSCQPPPPPRRNQWTPTFHP